MNRGANPKSQGTTGAMKYPPLRNRKINFSRMSTEEFGEIVRIYNQDHGTEVKKTHLEPPVDLKQGPHVTGKEIGEAALMKYNQEKGEKYVFLKTVSILWRVEQERFHFNFLADHESHGPQYFFGDVVCGESGYDVICCELLDGEFAAGLVVLDDPPTVFHPPGTRVPWCLLCEQVSGLYAPIIFNEKVKMLLHDA